MIVDTACFFKSRLSLETMVTKRFVVVKVVSSPTLQPVPVASPLCSILKCLQMFESPAHVALTMPATSTGQLYTWS